MEHKATHSIICDVPVGRVYRFISDSPRWPDVLEPCEAVTVVSSDDDSEHIEVTARVNDQSMTWQSRRRFLPAVYGVDAVVVRPMTLVKAMTTSWRVVALNSQQSLLLLEHDYDLCGEVSGLIDGVRTHAEASRFIATAIDRNSTTELGNIKASVEADAYPEIDDSVASEQHMRHSIICRAPADAVYQLVRSTSSWPRIFDACQEVSLLEVTPDSELVRVYATSGGGTVSWDTRRRYSDSIRRVDYQLITPMPLVSSMRGEWRVIELGPELCLLTVDRAWQLLPEVAGIQPGIDTPSEAARYLRGYLHGNADAEMLAIRALAEEQTDALTSLTSRFPLPFPAHLVYGVLADVTSWPKILPHCESLQVRHDDGQHQEFTMDVQTAQGTEMFRSVRLCDAERLTITYFQPDPPATLARHSGSWEIRAAGGGCEVISRHTALLDLAACAKAFGTDEVSALKGRVRDQLEANSGLTVQASAAFLAGAVATDA
jgi:ribosome-associated toxin RatA of RatAB toxin-antitoxin module